MARRLVRDAAPPFFCASFPTFAFTARACCARTPSRTIAFLGCGFSLLFLIFFARGDLVGRGLQARIAMGVVFTLRCPGAGIFLSAR
ncbi:hypothetical protein B0H19DRAFT_1133919 [Mycena capillaripes]|nr:hypothetical protein B0H19DRAFT_1133919 [Mycena capillaripes]